MRIALGAVVLLLYAAHQDFWLWRTVRPLALGFVPIGLWYHVGYCVAVSVVMWMLVRWAWPAWLEPAIGEPPRDPS